MLRRHLLLLLLGACFHPTYDNPKCGPAGECPSGLTCVANICTSHASGTDGDIDTTSGDAPIDTPNTAQCGTPISCPTPTGSSQLTICGQLYDFQTNAALTGTGATVCDPAVPTTSGPCALKIDAYDALTFASGPTTSTPLSVGSLTIDTCGRYRVSAIETSGTGPFIGLRIDDADANQAGPTGTTVPVLIAVAKADGPVIQDFEAWIVKSTTTAMWNANGGPSLAATGMFAAVFRAHKKGNGDPLQPQGSGVQITKSGAVISSAGPGPAYYFSLAETTRTMVDTNRTATGANSTGLVTNASISDSLAYGGTGGLGTGCRWASYAGASLPGIVFIQVFRKIDVISQTCND